MVCRGIWNVRFRGKWYRFYYPRGRTSSPHDESTFRMIKQLCDHPDLLEKWELVPFLSPIHSNLDYVYIIDQDAGVFVISLWKELNGSLRPTAIRMDLTTLCESSRLFIQDSLEQPKFILSDNIYRSNPSIRKPITFRALDINLGIPTPLNELQERFFTDFVFVWRYYIDDPLTWGYSSPVFKVLSIAFLRLAAWDLELSSDANVELPISFASIPSWDYPQTNIYWFHGFLIILQEDIELETMINDALEKAKPYIDDLHGHRDARLVLISPYHVTFVELSYNAVLVSESIALLTNRSAVQCSPGFRALSRIFTSDCWKKSLTDRERWTLNVPSEILYKILHELEPRDTVAFSQASFTATQYYYTSIPQIKDTVVQSFNSSIPCCGRQKGLGNNGVRCPVCYSWWHLACIGAESWSSDGQYICMECQGSINFTAVHPGGINGVSCRKTREACQISVGGSEKLLQLRLSKPSHLRQELQFLGNLVSIAPSLIEYTILFNSSFSGLAYGLENRL
ncbi:hypothetical protein BDV40DRAFT_284440 [Aspergillus tamarii]|uniref:F-box domain-containing protein n=1 Tax=Aspergillus tamarii TaxID=41984 RepID=A0A5N6VAL6_ASPTM|nr:hypothetical protein BDV40DRAFT_284440 [Aspergillus tamarii]